MLNDLFFLGVVAAMMLLGAWRPFLFVLAYIYVDLVSPQQLSYVLLEPVPLSLLTFMAAFGSWLILDDKRTANIGPRQIVLMLLLIYCYFTTINADFPLEAAAKWDWVWKALVFAIFLPLTLTTRLRIEAAALVMVLSAAVIIVPAGIKTILSGGGYGTLRLLMDSNTGLYESSILSCAAIAVIPVTLCLMRQGTVFPPDWRVRLFCIALCFACILIPIGTQARTGLVCAAVLAFTLIRFVKHRVFYLAATASLAIAAIPFLPQSFVDRMETITEAQADQSASTRLAVWRWTLNYVELQPLGGGFDAYRGNAFRFEKRASERFDAEAPDAAQMAETQIIEEKARAYHSAYFEMLGEQGWPGLILWLFVQVTGLFTMERLFRRYRHSPIAEDGWIAGFALALQQANIVYLVGALFVGIAFMPFALMLIALQIALQGYARRMDQARRGRRFPTPVPASA